MAIIRTSIAGLALLAVLSTPSLASTRSHYHRVDKSITAAAHQVLQDAGLDAGVTVRSTRGRLVIDGAATDARLAALKAKLLATTGAYSVTVR